MREAIKQIPGQDGWWSSSGEETFLAVADRMLGAGMEADDVVEILEQAYGAVANEFGA